MDNANNVRTDRVAIPPKKNLFEDFRGGRRMPEGWGIRDAIYTVTPQDNPTIDRKGK